MNWLVSKLQTHPEMVIFLTLALGYAAGRVRIGNFTLGAVTGTLLAGVLIGQIHVSVSDDLKTTFFLLFLFSIGYRVGPQFFSGLKKEGLPQLALTAILCGSGLVIAIALSVLFGFDAGTAAGLMAGALTESATVGTAGDAIRRMGQSPEQISILTANVATAFAVAYLVGIIGVTWFLSNLAPRIMAVDIAAECQKLEAEMGRAQEMVSDLVSARRSFELRAFRIPVNLAGQTVAQIEAQVGARLFVEQVRRDGRVIESAPDLTLAKGDVIAVSGRREYLVGEQMRPFIEVEDEAMLGVPATAVDIVVTNSQVSDQTLADLADKPDARGIFLRRMTRGGHELPIAPATVVNRGDVLTIVGLERHVAKATKYLGYADRPTSATNMIVVSAGIFIGALVGLPAIHFGSLEIGLGTSVGALLGGLVCGWLRATRRSFAGIPEAALWIFDSLGLTAFIAVVGLSAGPRFFTGLVDSGVSLVLAALCVVMLPHLITVLVGHRLMKINPAILLGICAGAGTSGPALAAIQETAHSKIPTLGYGVPYAVGNVLLALWGTVIIDVLR
ncbi:aspartate-alanine antiporter [Mesorhizobium sophorae]|uniref:aspartate-alanine antiporter n=1 Tax=Mesorhizobium sophorae TaxID=1300294 RepID=UPI00117E27BF|nr:aspartate-alanine antiporter [Mesorhizobium sophorae]